MDGDSRGGAALSVNEVSGKPIKFVGVGEKMDSLEPFYPERMAGRWGGAGQGRACCCVGVCSQQRMQQDLCTWRFGMSGI
jgi:hypothetical protein